MRALVCALVAAAVLVAACAAPSRAYLDERTNFSAPFLHAACTKPLCGAWARCVPGGGGVGAADVREGRAIVLPPFPRYAVVNPMHALVDHAWAFAAVFSACVGVGEGERYVVLQGVRRSQVEHADVGKDLTAKLDLDLSEIEPTHPEKEQPNAMAGAPTWGQWVLYLWAKTVVPPTNVLFQDDIAALPAEGICFDKGVLALCADFFGISFRTLRVSFRLPGTSAEAAIPWPDFPDRWKVRGLADLRRALISSLKLSALPREHPPAAGPAPEEYHPERELTKEPAYYAAANVEPTADDVGPATLLRVLVTSRRGDSRRRWRNADAVVERLKTELGDTGEVRVIDDLAGMGIATQAKEYNWADVLVGIHGASMANAIFMRDRAAIVEVWRCCYDQVDDGQEGQFAWTGWLMARCPISLRYLGCKEVEEDGKVMELPPEEKNLSAGDLCAMPSHMNPLYVDVDPEAVVESVLAARRDAETRVEQGAVPRLALQPPSVLKSGGPEDGDKVMAYMVPPLDRHFAPSGPAWSEQAVWTEESSKQLERFQTYLFEAGQRMKAFWATNQERFEGGLEPLTLDSIIESLPLVNMSTAWHLGIEPEMEGEAKAEGGDGGVTVPDDNATAAAWNSSDASMSLGKSNETGNSSISSTEDVTPTDATSLNEETVEPNGDDGAATPAGPEVDNQGSPEKRGSREDLTDSLVGGGGTTLERLRFVLHQEFLVMIITSAGVLGLCFGLVLGQTRLRLRPWKTRWSGTQVDQPLAHANQV